MPKATCSFASLRTSASAGVAAMRATAAQAAMRRVITESTFTIATRLAGMQGNYGLLRRCVEQAICHDRGEESCAFRRFLGTTVTKYGRTCTAAYNRGQRSGPAPSRDGAS